MDGIGLGISWNIMERVGNSVESIIKEYFKNINGVFKGIMSIISMYV